MLSPAAESPHSLLKRTFSTALAALIIGWQYSTPLMAQPAPTPVDATLPAWLNLRFGTPYLPDTWVLSADQRRLTTVCFNGPVTVWDTKTGRRLVRLDKVPGQTVAHSKAGDLLLSHLPNDRYRAIELPTGRVRWEIKGENILLWHLTASEVLGFTSKELVRWDIGTGKLLDRRPLVFPEGETSGASFFISSANFHFLGYPTRAGLRIWDIEKWALVADVPLGNASARSGRLSNDGQYLVTEEVISQPPSDRIDAPSAHRSYSGPGLHFILDTVPARTTLIETRSGRTLWTHDWGSESLYSLDLENGAVKVTGRKSHFAWAISDGHEVPLASLTSPDDLSVTISPEELLLEIRKAASSELVSVIPPGPTAIRSAQWSPDGKNLFTVDHGLTLWDLDTGKVERQYLEDIYGIAAQANGAILLDRFPQPVFLDARTLQPVNRFRPPEWYETRDKRHFRDPGTMRISPDGRHYLVTSNAASEWARRGELQVWSERGVLPRLTIPHFGGHVQRDYATNVLQYSAFVPRQDAIIAPGLVAGEPGLRLFDLRTGRLTRLFHWPGQSKARLKIDAVSTDGRFLAGRLANQGQTNRSIIWDLQTGQQTGSIAHSATHLSFSPDGHWLAAGNQVWPFDARRGTTYGTPRNLPVPGEVVWSPDRRRFAVITGEPDARVVIFDMHFTLLASLYRTREPSESAGPFAATGWVCLTPQGYFNASPNAVQLLAFNDTATLAATDERRQRLQRPDLVRRALNPWGTHPSPRTAAPPPAPVAK
jgi:WD40 repeat protein